MKLRLRQPRMGDSGEYAEVHVIGRRGERILVERDTDIDRGLVLPTELDATTEEIEAAVTEAQDLAQARFAARAAIARAEALEARNSCAHGRKQPKPT